MSKFEAGDRVRIVGDWETVRKAEMIPESEPEGTGHMVVEAYNDRVSVYATGWRTDWWFEPHHLAHIDEPEQVPKPDEPAEPDEPKIKVTRHTRVSIDGYGDVYVDNDGDVWLDYDYISPKHARAVAKAILICIGDEHE